MTCTTLRRLAAPMVAVALGLGAAPHGARAADPALLCEKAAGISLVSCVKKVGKQQGTCFLEGGAACGVSDAKILKALDKLAKKIGKRCPSDATVQAAGFGSSMTPAGLIARLKSFCRAETASLAARTFGGPHGAVLAGQDESGRACLAAGARLRAA